MSKNPKYKPIHFDTFVCYLGNARKYENLQETPKS